MKNQTCCLCGRSFTDTTSYESTRASRDRLCGFCADAWGKQIGGFSAAARDGLSWALKRAMPRWRPLKTLPKTPGLAIVVTNGAMTAVVSYDPASGYWRDHSSMQLPVLNITKWMSLPTQPTWFPGCSRRKCLNNSTL